MHAMPVLPVEPGRSQGTGQAETAIIGVPTPVGSAALYARFASQHQDSPGLKVVAALRNQFGGQTVRSS